MQLVTPKWLENQRKNITSEALVDIKLDVPDEGFPKTTKVSDNAHAEHSRAVNVTREFSSRGYGTFETNAWVLDGSISTVRDGYTPVTGYIGAEIGDIDGLTSENSILTVDLGQQTTVLDLVIHWDKPFDDFPIHYKVRGYRNEAVAFTYEDDENDGDVSYLAVGYELDVLSIEVIQWSSPFRRPKIEHLELVRTLTFDKSDIIDLRFYQEVDPLMGHLPRSGVSFSIDNTDDKFNPYNLDSTVTQELMEQIPVRVRYGFDLDGGDTYISGGTYYLSEWNAPQNGLVANFVATDLVGFLNETTYIKGVYDEGYHSLYDLAIAVLEDAVLPDGATWDIDNSLRRIWVDAPLPRATHAECLQAIANAACGVMYCDREGTLHIEPLDGIYMWGNRLSGTFHSGSTMFLPQALSMQTYPIDGLVSYRHPEVSLTKSLKDVSVTVYNYNKDSNGNTVLYDGGIYLDGEETFELVYTSPGTGVSMNISGVGTLEDWSHYTHATEVVLDGDGEVGITITGHRLDISEHVVRVRAGDTGETQEVKNPLITTREHAKRVGEWVRDYLSNRKLVNFEWRTDPRLDALDVVLMVTRFGSSHVLMTDLDIGFDGTFKGRGEGRDIGAMGGASL